MPRKASKNKSLSRKQMMEVRRIAERVVDEEIEDKQVVTIAENQQLYHNKPIYHGKLIGGAITQGVKDGDQAQAPLGTRIGDQISLKNVNIRLWLSNKLDRPNCMYKGVLFWYESGGSLTDPVVYKTQTNKMLDRYNNKEIRIVDQFILKSKEMYDNGTEKWEHSYLAGLNKSYKNKKITFNNNGPETKGWELGFALVVYDAYGTLQTDNIASYAFNIELTYQDA